MKKVEQHWLSFKAINATLINCSLVSNGIGTYHGPLLILENQQDPQILLLHMHTYVGGAMIVYQSNVSLIGSKFEMNHAGIGGAVYSTFGIVEQVS